MQYLQKSIAYFLLLLMISCGEGPLPDISFRVENKSDILLKEHPIRIPAADLDRTAPEKQYPFLLTEDGDSLAIQLDDTDGDARGDEYFFLADLPAHTNQVYRLQWSADSMAFSYRTRVRHGVRLSMDDTVRRSDSGVFLPSQLPLVTGFQPFQTDGPSWENDKVGFRHYLDGRNSKDIFGKRVAAMSPQNVGINQDGVTEDNYAVMNDWGQDILAVGNSLGAGGISLLLGKDSLFRMGSIEGDTLGPIDRTIFQIYEEGPIRSIIHFDYQNWKLPNGRHYDAQETVEIWPGMYGYKNTVSYSGLKGDEQLVIGLVNLKTEKKLKEIYANDQWVILSTHDKQTIEKEWYLGLALIVPRAVYKGFIEAPKTGRLSSSYLAKMAVEDNKPVSYYTMACWELQDPNFKREEYFDNYLQEFVEQLSADVEVTVINH